MKVIVYDVSLRAREENLPDYCYHCKSQLLEGDCWEDDVTIDDQDFTITYTCRFCDAQLIGGWIDPLHIDTMNELHHISVLFSMHCYNIAAYRARTHKLSDHPEFIRLQSLASFFTDDSEYDGLELNG